MTGVTSSGEGCTRRSPLQGFVPSPAWPFRALVQYWRYSLASFCTFKFSSISDSSLRNCVIIVTRRDETIFSTHAPSLLRRVFLRCCVSIKQALVVASISMHASRTVATDLVHCLRMCYITATSFCSGQHRHRLESVTGFSMSNNVFEKDNRGVSETRFFVDGHPVTEAGSM